MYKYFIGEIQKPSAELVGWSMCTLNASLEALAVITFKIKTLKSYRLTAYDMLVQCFEAGTKYFKILHKKIAYCSDS